MRVPEESEEVGLDVPEFGMPGYSEPTARIAECTLYKRTSMSILPWDRRSLPVILCVLTLICVGLLLVWDVLPGLFPAKAHDFLAALPLVMIACACLMYEALRRPSRSELVKAILLACAFLFWAANQLWPALPQATLFNDIAIGLFVFDVFLAMTSRPDPMS
jgi:hypothetical protein